MEIRILTQDDIKEVMPMKEAIEADKEALKMYSGRKCQYSFAC